MLGAQSALRLGEEDEVAAHEDGVVLLGASGLGRVVPADADGEVGRLSLAEDRAEHGGDAGEDDVLGEGAQTVGQLAPLAVPAVGPLCDAIASSIRGRGLAAVNLAGRTTLREFIDLAAACRLFLTNDSGAMHIASAAGVRTVAIFGATDELATGPTGPLARVVREKVECSPCLLRECPIDHRCMTRVTPDRVAVAALELLR